MTKRAKTLTTTIAIVAGLLFAPLAVEAQQVEKVYRIGFITRGSADAYKAWLAGFRQGLHKLGYREGENLVIEDRYAAGHRERLPGLTEELVRLEPDVIVTHGGSIARAADRAATRLRFGSCVPARSADAAGAFN